MPERSTRLTTDRSDRATWPTQCAPIALISAALLASACGDSRDILTVKICDDTLEKVESVNLLIRRPGGFLADPEFTIDEGAFVTPLEGPYAAEHRFELAEFQGEETVMARVSLTDGCELVTAEVPVNGTLDICETGRDIEPTLALGNRHTCALFSDGSVRCFGENDNLQLGTDITDIAAMAAEAMCPVPISPAVDIVAGEFHSCALLENGDVRCWGGNDQGQLGNGRTAELPMLDDPSRYPPVLLADRAVSLHGGRHHNCAVLEGRQRLQCWGDNTQGQLGVGTREDVGDDEEPDLYPPIDLGAPIIDVAPADEHTCVLLDIDGGQIRCWGRNNNGQLGYGNGDDGPVDAPPDDGVNIGQVPVALAASYLHSCAVRSPEPPDGPFGEPVPGEVVCWGINEDSGNDGFLGYGNTTAYGLDQDPDVALQLPGPVIQLAVGRNFTCALFDNNDVRCWGHHIYGRLAIEEHGDDVRDTADLAAVAPSVVARPEEVVEAVFTGRNHACVLVSHETGKRARCWGQGEQGQLGTGAGENIGSGESPVVGGAQFELGAL